MTNDQFQQWVAAHIQATGADSERVSELLWANSGNINEKWNASYEEMCEASDRLVEFGRVPAFASDHTNALKAELDTIRSDRRRAESQKFQRELYGQHQRGCDCPSCNGGNASPAWESARARLHAAATQPKKRGCK